MHVGDIYCSGDLFYFFCPESVTFQGNAPLLIDGFALVAALGRLEKAKIFGGFADCYVDNVLPKVLNRCITRPLSETDDQDNNKTSILQGHGAACALRYRRNRGFAVDEVTSISHTRRQQSGPCKVHVRELYRNNHSI